MTGSLLLAISHAGIIIATGFFLAIGFMLGRYAMARVAPRTVLI